MRVVFLTHNYPREPGDVAGAFLETLARGLVAHGHAVTVVAPSHRGRGGDADEGGVRVRRVRYAAPDAETLAYGGTMMTAVRSLSGLQRLLALTGALRRAAADALRSADVLHAHWWIPAGVAAPGGAPLVLTSHGTDAALLTRSRAARLLARPVYRRAQVVTAVSRQLGDWIETATGRTIDAAHIHPMPVEVARFRRSSGDAGFIVVARLTRQKRVDLALRAVAALGEAAARQPLTIVGDGPERTALESLAAELGLGGRVRFLGAVPPVQVPDLLAEATLMLATAEGEGFGLSAAEALMSGVPVVACHDGGGLLDVVPPAGAGRLADPDPRAIARAAEELLADAAAPAAAAALGAQWRERLSAAGVARRCAAWYDEALGRAGA